MSKKQIAVLIIIAAVAVFFAVRIIRNAMTSEEAKIKKMINEFAEEFEQKKFSNIFDHITEDYTDKGGNTKKSLKESAKLIVVYVSEINISISDLRVVVSRDRKTAEAGFMAKAHFLTKFRDENIDEPIIFSLRRENGKWMLYKSNLGQYGEGF